MNKMLNFSLLSLVIAITLLVTSQNIKAEYACASNQVYCDPGQCYAPAKALCEPACQTIGATWNGSWTNGDSRCKWFSQYALCGCNPGHPCQCKNGNQSVCDESNNPLGAGKCKTDCDCSKGRYCNEDGSCYDRNKCSLDCKYNEYCDKDGACREDPNCCNKSMQIFTQCTLGCGTSWTCNSQCELMYKAHASTCNNGKGGCAPAPSSKNKHGKNQQKKQEVPLSTPPKPEIAPTTTPPLDPKPKETPRKTPTEAPKEKDTKSSEDKDTKSFEDKEIKSSDEKDIKSSEDMEIKTKE